MSNMYSPDRWVLVDLTHGDEIIRKVFAGWYGGWAGSDSWKLSSQVIETTDCGDYFEFLNYSGSTYRCHKNSEGMSGYMSDVFAGWHSQNNDEISVELVWREKE